MKPYRNLIFLLVFGSLFFSCASHQQTAREEPDSPSSSKTESLTIRKIIVQSAIDCIGLPYHWGGQSPDTGFDCSGLMVFAYKKTGIMLPRTTTAQYIEGNEISKRKLLPADLVFFQIPEGKSRLHVGMYIGNKTFIHAPGKGRKVSYGQLDNPYFKKYWIDSRRYL